MNRLEEKSNLLIQLGVLFGPMQELVAHPERYNDQEVARVQAQFFASYSTLLNGFSFFCTGEPGCNYAIQNQQMSVALQRVSHRISMGESLEVVVSQTLDICKAAIDAVPIPATSVILEAGSPFTAFRRLRELCECDATTSLTWIDPYADVTVFLRYLSHVRPNVPITLIIAELMPKPSKRDQQRRDELMDASRLYAREVGPTMYKLVIRPNLHDRWVVFDEKRIYNLGGSSNAAGSRSDFTITSVDPTPENLDRIAKHITTGTEWFGPTQRTHL